jgi:Spy/CpxP family protein refolding chaperone
VQSKNRILILSIMKKIVMILFVVCLVTGSGYAQQMDPAARLQREIEGLTAALGLNADEVAKITPIVTEGQKKQSEAFAKMREAGGEMDREKMRETRTKIMGETDKALKAVLTPEQGVKLDEFRKKQAEERAKRMQGQG